MIEITNITKRYGNKKVLSDVTFCLNDATICGLIGLNGAGKSTLMKIFCSLVYEDFGSIKVDGQVITTGERVCNQSIGYMIESPAFYNHLTGKENLSILATLYPKITKGRIDEVLKLTGIYDNRDTIVKKYSLGMKQRLHFAYALINKPKILILDEPFNGIDPVTTKLFKDIIKEIKRGGGIVLISSHMITDIKLICDKVVIIDKGIIVHNDLVTEDLDIEELFLSKVTKDGRAQ